MHLKTTRNLFAALALCASVAFGGTELSSAVDAFKKGDYKAAIECAEMVDAQSPDHAKALYLVGETQLLLGDAAAAEVCFRALLGERAQSLPARTGLGRALTALGKLDDAEKELRCAVAADAKDAQARRALGEALTAAKKLVAAKTELAEAAKLAPGDAWIARSQVELALLSDEAKDAARIAKALCKAQPKHPLGPFLSGVVLEKQGEDDEAIEAYEKALALDETFLDAHKNLAILCHTMSATYSNTARVRKSLEHYERYFALGGKDPELKQTYEQVKSFVEPMLPPVKDGKGK